MKPDDDVFIVTLKFGIVKGKFLKKINDTEFEVLMECPNGKTKMQLHKKFVYFNKEDAEKKLCSLIHWSSKKKLSKAVEGNIDFLPEPIAIGDVYHSGNPLRFGEPKIISPIQTNVVGATDNPQKIIQLIGAIWEDIEMLQHILYVLSYANDYTKKLIGKYIIIEFKSLSSSFKRLSELDKEYKDNLYTEFVDNVTKLDDEFKFGVVFAKGKPVIRNKISAHRDSNLDLITAIGLWGKITRYNINKYIEVFSEHINGLMKKYPFESKMYFTMRREPYRSINDVTNPADNPYQPFDEVFGPRKEDKS